MIGDLDLTMLRQMSNRAHIDALLRDQDASGGLANILEPGNKQPSKYPVQISSTEAAGILAGACALDETEYNALLYYLHNTGRPYRASTDFPHPANANILPPQAQRPPQINHEEHTFSCQQSHRGNSAIQFYNPLTQSHDTGFIQAIWVLPLESSKHEFLVICPHKKLSIAEQSLAPFQHYPGFMTQIVDATPSESLVIIEPIHIVTHLTTFLRPKGTYGIDKETLIICQALNRGRH